jgi:anti-sigma factor RsiW
MDCNDSQRLLAAEVDGELGVSEHLSLQAHLQTCPECARRMEFVRERRTALRENLRSFVAPPHLRKRISDALPSATTAAPYSLSINFPFWPALGLAASFALVALLGFSWGTARSHMSGVMSEAVSDHVRSLQASHLTDVTSTDQHTVKPWFAGRLDFSPPVVDLVTEGFPLAGGRLERIDGRSAAALVFRRRQHVINLIVWPLTTALASERHAINGGYFVEMWSQGGFNFLAVSDLSSGELAQFSEAFRAHFH